MKYAYLVPAAAVMVLAASSALAQNTFVQNPGSSGNPGAIIHAGAFSSGTTGGHNRYSFGHTYAKDQMLENGRAMLRDIKKQLAVAKTDEERQALLERKHQIENAMIDAQQRY